MVRSRSDGNDGRWRRFAEDGGEEGGAVLRRRGRRRTRVETRCRAKSMFFSHSLEYCKSDAYTRAFMRAASTLTQIHTHTRSHKSNHKYIDSKNTHDRIEHTSRTRIFINGETKIKLSRIPPYVRFNVLIRWSFLFFVNKSIRFAVNPVSKMAFCHVMYSQSLPA